MALDNYANLKAEIIDWSHRDDLNTRIDSFIDLAETEMLANTIEPLRLRATETRADFFTNTTDRFAALPTGYQSGRKLRIQGIETEILNDPEFDTASAAGVDTADYTIPANASITGGSLVFGAAETATSLFTVETETKYRLEYEIAVAALTAHKIGGVTLNTAVGTYNHQITTAGAEAQELADPNFLVTNTSSDGTGSDWSWTSSLWAITANALRTSTFAAVAETRLSLQGGITYRFEYTIEDNDVSAMFISGSSETLNFPLTVGSHDVTAPVPFEPGNLQIQAGASAPAITQFKITPTTAHSIAGANTSEMSYFRMREIAVEKSQPLRFRTPEQLNIRNSVGMPTFFTITDQIEFDRISDQVYVGEIQHFADFTALSSSNTTNTVLTNHPTIYLFGALWSLKTFTNEPSMADAYYQKFINAIRGANNKDKLGRYGPAPIMRVEGSTP